MADVTTPLGMGFGGYQAIELRCPHCGARQWIGPDFLLCPGCTARTLAIHRTTAQRLRLRWKKLRFDPAQIVPMQQSEAKVRGG